MRQEAGRGTREVIYATGQAERKLLEVGNKKGVETRTGKTVNCSKAEKLTNMYEISIMKPATL